MRDQFANTFYEEAMGDPRLAIVVADISPAGAMTAFREKFPDRFINVGVSEQIMIGMAAGLAMQGFKPFVYTIATFTLYRPFEFIRNDLAYQQLPVTLIGMGAGVVYSTLGATHQAMEDIAISTAIPGMNVLAPCDPEETQLLTQWCTQENQKPTYLRIGKAGEKNYTENAQEPLQFGKLRKLCEGTEIGIITYGPTGIKIAFELKNDFLHNYSISIFSCHTIKPLDTQGILMALQNHPQVIVIEEHVPHGGLSDRVKALAWDHSITTSLQCFTLKDHFFHYYGSHEGLLEQHGLTAKQIAAEISKTGGILCNKLIY